MDNSSMNTRNLLTDWRQKAREVQTGHYVAAQHYSRLNVLLGIPVVVLSAAVGTTVFAALGNNPEPAKQILVGILSVTAAVLAALQTFLGFANKAEVHRAAGSKFGAVRREIEETLARFHDASNSQPVDISEIRLTLDKYSGESPAIPQWLFERGKKVVAKYD